MQFARKEMENGYHDFWDNEPSPYAVGSDEHRLWCAGWVLAAQENCAIPELPPAYERELLSRDRKRLG